VPGWYLGWSLSCLGDYYEHWGAKPGDPPRTRLELNNPVYNLVSFNNGFHQEHHYRPQTHWTRMAEVRAEFGELFERRRPGDPGTHILA